MSRRRLTIILLIGVATVLGGCPAADPDDYRDIPEAYVPLKQLVADYNANAAKVPRLWARAKIRIKLPGLPAIGSTSSVAESNGYLMLDKSPDPGGVTNFVLIRKELQMNLFRVGVDAHSIPSEPRYYIWFNAGSNRQALLGRCKYAGAPNVQAAPIDPMQLVEVLGVTELPTPQAGGLPAVVVRMEGRPPAYVVRYLKPQPVTGELKIWREIHFGWSQDQPPRAQRVKLLDADGLVRVIAELGDYQPIEWPGQAAGPVMPTDFKIRWPQIKGIQPASSLHIVLSEMSTTHRFGDTIFDFERNLPAGMPVEVLDAAYDLTGTERGEK